VITSQYKAIKGLLEEIRDRLPVRDIPEEPVTVRRMDGSRTTVGTPRLPKSLEVAADKRQALAVMRAVLDDWIRGSRENHYANDHRNENAGEECWRTFDVVDVRNMINDAARKLGLLEFPIPTEPEEDKRR